MWDENAPLELLKEMPKVLTIDNLSKIQEVIDKDKYLNSLQLGGDLCGKYSPFCDWCDKTVKYPCAVAYVKMMQQEGMDVEIGEMPYVEPVAAVAAEEKAEEPYEEPAVTEEIEQEPVAEQEEPAPAKSSGNRIRIAIARKKV